MTLGLDASLALARQYFDELVRIAPIDALNRREYGHGPARERVEFLLGKLNGLAGAIERHLTATKPADTPIVTLGARHISFYKDVLLPNIGALKTAYLD